MKEPVPFPYQPPSGRISLKKFSSSSAVVVYWCKHFFIVARLNSTILAWATGQLMNYVQCKNVVLAIFF